MSKFHLYINQKETKQEILLKFTHHMPPMASNVTSNNNKVIKTFHMNYYVKVNTP
jgi:hypothetical protein